MQHASWPSLARLSSGLGRIDGFLGQASFDRGPWLAVAFGAGIAAWFVLPRTGQWQGLIVASLVLAMFAAIPSRPRRQWPFVVNAVAAMALAFGAGCGVIWVRSSAIGTPGLARPVVGTLVGKVQEWRVVPAEQRGRLILLTRDPLDPERAMRVRISVPLEPGQGNPEQAGLTEGAVVRVRARLMPPAPPLLPGSYDFARAAWFAALGATGTAIDSVEVIEPGRAEGTLGPLRRSLSRHIAAALSGSPGGIASALASGDRGAIARSDEDAMRDAGLTHLLSVSGLHVSAVIAAAYLLALRLLALWPWLALRVRLPLVAAGAGAGAGVFYTALTGAEVPTLRSTFAALLALLGVALGREPLSLRLLAVASFALMLFWPESVVGPSFQLSFAAALAIVSLHGTGWMRRLVAAQDEGWPMRGLRMAAGLLVTGLVVELALLPIGLFHFHRAGLYGVLANVLAIPLTTFVTMPLVALALVLDCVGLGQPVWWLAGWSIRLLLDLAHLVAQQPGAVILKPAMGVGTYGLFLAGGLWLALWSGPVRRWGLPMMALATGLLTMERVPDVLISGDGRLVAFPRLASRALVVLRPMRSQFAQETLAELTGLDRPAPHDAARFGGGAVAPVPAPPGAGLPEPLISLDTWPGARCNPDYCLVLLGQGEGARRFLLSRGRDPAPMRDLVAVCARVDVAIADLRLPWACRPTWLKLDRSALAARGGIALWLGPDTIRSVAQGAGEHGWWRKPPVPSFARSSGRALSTRAQASTPSGSGATAPPASPEP